MIVSKEDDWYLARAEGLSIFTEAKSLDELKKKIREAVDLHLDEGQHQKYGLPANPAIRLIYRFDEYL